MPLSKIKSFSISRKPEKWTGLKSCIIWAKHDGHRAPIAYISKPKHVPQKLFDEFMQNIQIHINMFPEKPES